jgi:hypothetical protein
MLTAVKSFSSMSDLEIMRLVEGQEALEHAFANVRPTDDLIKRCYRALANAGVKALPVRRQQ